MYTNGKHQELFKAMSNSLHSYCMKTLSPPPSLFPYYLSYQLSDSTRKQLIGNGTLYYQAESYFLWC